jgi:hypothetical protein
MSFHCPQCLKRGSLEIILSIQFPPDSRSDDIALQVVRCSECSFRALAVYEESMRGALDVEDWEHNGYRVGEKDLDRITAEILSCPDPTNGRCECSAHQHLGRKDLHGRWNGLNGIELGEEFAMHMVL